MLVRTGLKHCYPAVPRVRLSETVEVGKRLVCNCIVCGLLEDDGNVECKNFFLFAILL